MNALSVEKRYTIEKPCARLRGYLRLLVRSGIEKLHSDKKQPVINSCCTLFLPPFQYSFFHYSTIPLASLLHRKYILSPGGRGLRWGGDMSSIVHPYPHPPPSRGRKLSHIFIVRRWRTLHNYKIYFFFLMLFDPNTAALINSLPYYLINSTFYLLTR